MQTRRSFLSISAAMVAGAALPPLAAAQSSSRIGGEVFTLATLGAYQQNLLTKGGVEGLVGSIFMVFVDDGKVAYLTLVKVKGLDELQADMSGDAKLLKKKDSAAVTRARGFVAIFDGETKKVPQGTYVVDHGRLGRVAMFLVPGRNEAGGTTVVATFTSL